MLYTGNYAVNTGQYDNKLKYLVSDAKTIRGRRSEYRNHYQSTKKGVRNNRYLNYEMNLTKIMKDGGYSVSWAGKWHHSTIAGAHF